MKCKNCGRQMERDFPSKKYLCHYCFATAQECNGGALKWLDPDGNVFSNHFDFKPPKYNN